MKGWGNAQIQPTNFLLCSCVYIPGIYCWRCGICVQRLLESSWRLYRSRMVLTSLSRGLFRVPPQRPQINSKAYQCSTLPQLQQLQVNVVFNDRAKRKRRAKDLTVIDSWQWHRVGFHIWYRRGSCLILPRVSPVPVIHYNWLHAWFLHLCNRCWCVVFHVSTGWKVFG